MGPCVSTPSRPPSLTIPPLTGGYAARDLPNACKRAWRPQALSRPRSAPVDGAMWGPSRHVRPQNAPRPSPGPVWSAGRPGGGAGAPHTDPLPAPGHPLATLWLRQRAPLPPPGAAGAGSGVQPWGRGYRRPPPAPAATSATAPYRLRRCTAAGCLPACLRADQAARTTLVLQAGPRGRCPQRRQPRRPHSRQRRRRTGRQRCGSGTCATAAQPRRHAAPTHLCALPRPGGAAVRGAGRRRQPAPHRHSEAAVDAGAAAGALGGGRGCGLSGLGMGFAGATIGWAVQERGTVQT